MVAACHDNEDIAADLGHPALHLLKLVNSKRMTIKLKRLQNRALSVEPPSQRRRTSSITFCGQRMFTYRWLEEL